MGFWIFPLVIISLFLVIMGIVWAVDDSPLARYRKYKKRIKDEIKSKNYKYGYATFKTFLNCRAREINTQTARGNRIHIYTSDYYRNYSELVYSIGETWQIKEESVIFGGRVLIFKTFIDYMKFLKWMKEANKTEKKRKENENLISWESMPEATAEAVKEVLKG